MLKNKRIFICLFVVLGLFGLSACDVAPDASISSSSFNTSTSSALEENNSLSSSNSSSSSTKEEQSSSSLDGENIAKEDDKDYGQFS